MKKIAEYIFIKFFGVVFNGDCSIYDRYKWLNKNLIPPKEDGTLLDLGCGNGWSLFLAKSKKYKEVTGLSWNEDEITRIKRRANILNKSINLEVGDARKLDIISFKKKFDVIINTENIEHIINAEKLIKDISFLLNDSGLLYLTTPNILYSKLYKDSLIKRNPIEDGGHVVRGYSKEKLKVMLEKYNLHIISTSYITGPLSRKLVSFQRLCPFLILKFFYIPISLIFNFLDELFFKNNKNNATIAIIAEKIIV